MARQDRPPWVGRATNLGALIPAAVLPVLVAAPLVPALTSGGTSVLILLPLVLLPMLLVGLPALAFSTVRVAVDQSEVAVGLGPWGWPGRRFAMADIGGARAELVEPLDYGGWGWRRGWRGAAVVVRRGEALVLDLRDGTTFTVTVDGAPHAATLVNGYRSMA